MVDKNKKQDELLDHNYDGIEEFDNDLPRWWVQLFWLTTVLGVVYAVWFHLPSTPTTEQRLAEAMAEIKSNQAASASSGSAAGLSEESLLALTKNSEVVAHGKEIFTGKCAACHGPEGQGLIGPNLTDKYWIHGGKMPEVVKVINEGVPAKGMLSWKALMSSDDINAVAAFIWTIRGTTPPNPKAAEGILTE